MNLCSWRTTSLITWLISLIINQSINQQFPHNSLSLIPRVTNKHLKVFLRQRLHSSLLLMIWLVQQVMIDRWFIQSPDKYLLFRAADWLVYRRLYVAGVPAPLRMNLDALGHNVVFRYLTSSSLSTVLLSRGWTLSAPPADVCKNIRFSLLHKSTAAQEESNSWRRPG